MTLEGLSSICAKLEPASFKNNEILILEINVLQKLTPHSLCVTCVNLKKVFKFGIKANITSKT